LSFLRHNACLLTATHVHVHVRVAVLSASYCACSLYLRYFRVFLDSLPFFKKRGTRYPPYYLLLLLLQMIDRLGGEEDFYASHAMLGSNGSWGK